MHVLKIFGSLMSCCNYVYGEYFVRMLVSSVMYQIVYYFKMRVCSSIYLWIVYISLEKGLLLPFVMMQMWIAKSEYDESGPSIVHRKCF